MTPKQKALVLDRKSQKFRRMAYELGEDARQLRAIDEHGAADAVDVWASQIYRFSRNLYP